MLGVKKMPKNLENATHSLRTEILMQLKNQGFDETVSKINDVAEGVASLSDSVGSINEAFKSLGSRNSPLSNLITSLNNFRIDSVTLDAGNLRKVLENKIASAITKSKIEFIGDTGERYPFIVSLKKDFWERNQRQISQALADSFSNLVVRTEKIPPLDTTQLLKTFQESFVNQITALVEDDKLLSLYRIDKKTGEKKFRSKKSLELPTEVIDKVIDNVQHSFVDFFSDPKNIVIDKIPKLNLTSTKLEEIVKNIQDNIGNIDKVLEIEPDTFKNLPNLSKKLTLFKKQLKAVVNDINNLAANLEGVTYTKATEAEIRNAVLAIDSLKTNVTHNIAKWIEKLSGGLETVFTFDTDLSTVKKQLNKLDSDINALLTTKVEVIKKNLFSILQSKIVHDTEFVGKISQGTREDEKFIVSAVDSINRVISEIMVKTVEQKIKNLITVSLKSIRNEVSVEPYKAVIVESVDSLIKGIYREVADVLISKPNLSSVLENIRTLDLLIENELFVKFQRIKSSINKAFELQSSAEINEIIKSKVSKDFDKKTLDSTVQKINKNIADLINKAVATKAKILSSKSNEVLKDVSSISLEPLKASLDKILINLLSSYSKLSETIGFDNDSINKIKPIYSKFITSFYNSFYSYTKQIAKSLETFPTDGLIIRTKDLHSDIKKSLAASAGLSVKDYLRVMPVIGGDKAKDLVMKQNILRVIDLFNKAVGVSIKTLIDNYKNSVKELTVKPDKSLVSYIYDQIVKLQDSVISKVKEMIKEQFRFLTDEVKAMNIAAKSLGYKPTQKFSQEILKANPNANLEVLNTKLASASNVADVRNIIADAVKNGEITIDNLVVQANEAVTNTLKDLQVMSPVQNVIADKVFRMDFPNTTMATAGMDLPTGYSEVFKNLEASMFNMKNAFKDSYLPVNLDTLLLGGGEFKRSRFSKIFSNMGKYFVAGFLMGLPIKTLQRAMKVSTELDYNIAKARQNILIKDPYMQNVARNKVYDDFKSRGEPVNTQEFREAVSLEARRMRTIMDGQINDYLLNISKAYYRPIDEIGRYYHISSRRAKDPYEALTRTREIAKITAAEEIDPELAATGIEAIGAQWGIPIGELDKYVNMMLKTAMLSNTTVADLVQTQRDTGAMFRSRLAGMPKEDAFATAMALSSMFVESTGKSGSMGGTFWRNIIQRPYVSTSREALEQASQIKGFENLTPYLVDERGNRVQKDFLTMFSDIIEAMIKVDDPSKLSLMSDLFPVRTIGGAESISTLVVDLKNDIEKSIESLKEMGELDPDATIDNVSIKEVFERYIKNIADVTGEDIAEYIAGLQDTFQFTLQGATTQWESTSYKIFTDLKEEMSTVLTYFTAILRKFEANSDALSELLKVFAKVGTGYGLITGYKYVQRRIEASPKHLTTFQKELATKYQQTKAEFDRLHFSAKAIEDVYNSEQLSYGYSSVLENKLLTDKARLESYLNDSTRAYFEAKKSGKLSELTIDPIDLMNASEKLRSIKSQLTELQKAKALYTSNTALLGTKDSILAEQTNLGNMLKIIKGGLGSRNIDEFKDVIASHYRQEDLYNSLAQFVMLSRQSVSEADYSPLIDRRTKLEEDYKSLWQRRAEVENTINIASKLQHNAFISDKSRQRISEKLAKAQEEYDTISNTLNETATEIGKINTKILEMNRAKLEQEYIVQEVISPHVTYDKDGQVIGVTPKTTEEKIKMFRQLFPAAGVELQRFESAADMLAQMFKEGKYDVDMYEDSIREVANRLGIAEKDFVSFKETIREINRAAIEGKKELLEYVKALESANGKRITPYVSTHGTSKQTAKQDPKAGGALGNILSIIGISTLFKGKGISSLIKSAGSAVLKGGKGLIAGAGRLAPQLALYYSIAEATSALFDAAGSWAMTDAEKMIVRADKYESMINKAVSFKFNDDDGIAIIGKLLFGGVSTAIDSITNQLTRILGGIAPSFGETWSTQLNAWSSDLTKEDLRTSLRDRYEVDITRNKGMIARQVEYLEKNPFITSGGELREAGDPYLLSLPLEELTEFLEKTINNMNVTLAQSDAQFTKERVNMLLNGLAANSNEIRKITEKYLAENIKQMEQVIEELKTYLERLVPGTENYRATQQKIADLETKLYELRLEKFDTAFSEMDSIVEKYNRADAMTQAEYDIKKYEAMLKGADKDSSVVKQIENMMASRQINLIEEMKSSLEQMLTKFRGKPEQTERILLQIKQLQAEQKKLLVDIKERLSENISTFNLPSDIQPITYYEAMTSRNTHRNVSIVTGDTVINITVPNMSGNASDLERMGRVVQKAVNDAQKNFVRQFANDVKSGMGKRYYSFNDY